MNRLLIPITTLALALALAGPSRAGAPETGAEPLAELPASEWTADHAAHLMRRAGFGGTPHEIVQLTMLGRDDAVARLVDYEQQPAGDPLVFPEFDLSDPATAKTYDRLVKRYVREMLDAARQRAAIDLEEALKVEPGAKGDAKDAKDSQPMAGKKPRRRRNNRQRQAGESVEAYVWRVARLRAVGATRRSMDGRKLALLRNWWLRRMALSRRPLEEKMTLFWHGHFATGYQTVRNARHMQIQNETFREHAIGDFGALVKAIARDPAMLRYLDGNRNVKAKPNENFGRELMELFTIGRGNYTEQDIKQAARAFTGWTFRGDRFVFNRRQHDFGEKTFFGKTGTFDGDDVIDIILADERTPRFIAWKLCRYFVSPSPDDALVDALAGKLRESDYQLKPTLRALFRSRAFYAAQYGHIKSPAELLVGLVRQLDLPPAAFDIAWRQMGQMGQDLFQPPNVKGWDGGRAWINSSTMLKRYNLGAGMVLGAGRVLQLEARNRAQAEAMGVDPENMMAGMSGDAPRRARRENRRGRDRNRQRNQTVAWPLINRLVDLEKPEPIVDHLIARLLQRPLDEARRAKLLAIVAPDGSESFDPRDRGSRQRLLQAIATLTAMPEYQLN